MERYAETLSRKRWVESRKAISGRAWGRTKSRKLDAHVGLRTGEGSSYALGRRARSGAGGCAPRLQCRDGEADREDKYFRQREAEGRGKLASPWEGKG